MIYDWNAIGELWRLVMFMIVYIFCYFLVALVDGSNSRRYYTK